MRGAVYCLFIILFSCLNAIPQPKKGSPGEIKESLMRANAVSAVVFNYGSIGKPNYLSGVGDLAWKNLGYLFEFGPMIAAKVIGSDGKPYNIISDSFILPGQGDYSPDGTLKWGWLPRAGFANPDQKNVATFMNPSSWPSTWTKWPADDIDGGLIRGDEAYYVMDDFSNAEYPYYPFPNDSTKRGLGVKAEVRVYQFPGTLKNSLIVKYKITNESPKKLDSVYFGFMGDPHIGGTSDYPDDMASVFNSNSDIPVELRNTIYVWDYDHKGAGGLVPGILSFKLLDTPDNLGLTSFHTDVYTNSLPNVPKNDQLMWDWFLGGIDTLNSVYKYPSDNIVHFGTGPFSLLPGETKNIKIAISLSDDMTSMRNVLKHIYYTHNWPFISSIAGSEGGDPNYKIKLSSFNGGIVKDSLPVTWDCISPNPNTKVFIEYSSDKGANWGLLSGEQSASSLFFWNTKNVSDGVNYLLRIVAYNPDNKSQFYYCVSKEKFTIDNQMNAKPEIEFTNLYPGMNLTSPTFKIDWNSFDADNAMLYTTLEYSTDLKGSFNKIIDNKYLAAGNHSISWDVSELPNYSQYFLKLTVSDGNSDTVIISPLFSINQQIASITNNFFKHSKGISTPELGLYIADPAKLTGGLYELSFTENNNSKIINIINLTSAKTVLQNVVLTEGMSTPGFEGLKLSITDKQADINIAKTKFNRAELNAVLNVSPTSILGSPIKTAEDWIVVFNNLDTLPNGNYAYPGETVKNQVGLATVCPFKIINYPSGQRANYLIYEPNGKSRNNGRWDYNETITLRPQAAAGNITCYDVKAEFTKTLKAEAGDTLRIITHKPITHEDVFRFMADTNYALAVKRQINIPAEYRLLQNYPNPFNPVTIISYNLAAWCKVTLKVYNVLGKEITCLVNKEQSEGLHTAIFDANSYNLSSGIYFYKLEAGVYQKVGKMILMK